MKKQKICCTIHASFHPNRYFCQENKFYVNLSLSLRSAAFLRGMESVWNKRAAMTPLCLSARQLQPLIFCCSTLQPSTNETEKRFMSFRVLRSSMLIQTAKMDKVHAHFLFHTSKGFVGCADYKRMIGRRHFGRDGTLED